jgi:hypothetical protein
MRRHRGRGAEPRFWRKNAGRPQPGPRGTKPTQMPDAVVHDQVQPMRNRNVERAVWAAAGLGLILATIRGLGIVDWSWAVMFAPFTVIGLLAVCVLGAFLTRQWWALRRADEGVTPAPEQLEPLPPTEDADLQVLSQHPELLAALCHGFRMKRLMPVVLGVPVTDPWGVYQASFQASETQLSELTMLASGHTTRLAESGRKDGGRVSDAVAMRRAVDAFRQCASRIEAGKGDPDCPFEHVVAIFGAKSPNRDANLRSVAPRVRTLLERQYPQLKTARLGDGSDGRFSDWGQDASASRAEVTRLRTERTRHEGTIRELRAALAEEQQRVESLRAAADDHRRQSVDAARAEQAAVVADLRASLVRAEAEQARERQRLQASHDKLAAAHEALASERDLLERALLATGDDAADGRAVPEVDLAGVRVLLVGGEANQVRPLREHLEARGVTLLHDDSVAAAEHVPHVQVVVFWIRYLSHPTYFGVRQRVRSTRTPHRYWGQTSAGSLTGLIVDALGDRRSANGAIDAPAPAESIADPARTATAVRDR